MNTKAGGRKAQQTLLKKFGSKEAVKAYYQDIGRMGGKKSKGTGFALDKVGGDGLTGRQRARIAGRVGGLKKRIKD